MPAPDVRCVDLVADVGEGFGAYRIGDDEGLIELLSSANVACGFHAGDPRVMETSVRLCIDSGVAIGAHPSFPDLVGFGRRAVDVSPAELRTDMLYQVGALSAFAAAAGTSLAHVAPHGRLANMLMVDEAYAEAVTDAVEGFDAGLVVLAQEGALTRAAQARGLKVGFLALADRAYQANGQLVPRSEPGAVLHDPDDVTARAVQMASAQTVRAITGEQIPVRCDSVLLHGDGVNAVDSARRIREGLDRAGVQIAPLAEVIAARALHESRDG